MKAVHFGGGNIGRGFIGEVLSQNGFDIIFVDVNTEIINALNTFGSYKIELAAAGKEQITVKNVSGINNQLNPEEVVAAFIQADIITTAIGPNILPLIAPLIAAGIKRRFEANIVTPIDVIACENMIGGSDYLKEEVEKHLSENEKKYLTTYIGFPNAAVDRIVPIQHHEDKLFVSVEPFKEWVVDAITLKNEAIQLKGVQYVENLLPFIERKLFTVNTGHATTAYAGKYYGFETIAEAIKDSTVKNQVQAVLKETGDLLITKWKFNPTEHQAYINKILSRFENPYISDEISRVARTPLRKLGYDERFIRPIRETNDFHLKNEALIKTVAMILTYRDEKDPESIELARLIETASISEVIAIVTNLTNPDLIAIIKHNYEDLVEEESIVR